MVHNFEKFLYAFNGKLDFRSSISKTLDLSQEIMSRLKAAYREIRVSKRNIKI